MARKKRIGKHRTHRRKKVGASKTGMFEILIGTVLGAVVGRIAYTSVQLPQYVMGVVQVLGGGGAAWFLGDMPLARGIGFGVLASGAEIVATETIPSMAGVDGQITYSPARKIAGYRDVARVGAFPKPASVGKTNEMMGRIYKGVY